MTNGTYPREKLKKRIFDRWSSQRSYGGNGSKGFDCKKETQPYLSSFSRNGKYKLKKTYWYLMTTSYDGILEPQLDEGIYRAEWKSKDEVPDLMENAYQNIKLLLKEIELI